MMITKHRITYITIPHYLFCAVSVPWNQPDAGSTHNFNQKWHHIHNIPTICICNKELNIGEPNQPALNSRRKQPPTNADESLCWVEYAQTIINTCRRNYVWWMNENEIFMLLFTFEIIIYKHETLKINRDFSSLLSIKQKSQENSIFIHFSHNLSFLF